MEALEMNNMITLLEESDVVVVGSPTINADAVKPAWDLLSCMAFLESRGKIGAVFGSYGWSGEAQNMIYHRMRGLKFRTPLEPLKFKLIPTKEELGKCYEFGAELSDIANGKSVEMSME
jgi:flavorubredoxin